VLACGGSTEEISEQAALKMYVEAVNRSHVFRELEREAEAAKGHEEQEEEEEEGHEEEEEEEEGHEEDEIHEEAFCHVMHSKMRKYLSKTVKAFLLMSHQAQDNGR
jgi:hypothetical protein